MNNSNNLSLEERAITPTKDFNKGINYQMSKVRRAAKQARYKANEANRRNQTNK
tara:strand:+ start:321 stop:482 length:162 start_codon:yes stop_codon:yes gene_type:complete